MKAQFIVSRSSDNACYGVIGVNEMQIEPGKVRNTHAAQPQVAHEKQTSRLLGRRHRVRRSPAACCAAGVVLSAAAYLFVLAIHVAAQRGLHQRVFSYAENPNGYLANKIPWHMTMLNWPHRIYQGGGRWNTGFGRAAIPQHTAWPDEVGSPHCWNPWLWIALGLTGQILAGVVLGATAWAASAACVAARSLRARSSSRPTNR